MGQSVNSISLRLGVSFLWRFLVVSLGGIEFFHNFIYFILCLKRYIFYFFSLKNFRFFFTKGIIFSHAILKPVVSFLYYDLYIYIYDYFISNFRNLFFFKFFGNVDFNNKSYLNKPFRNKFFRLNKFNNAWRGKNVLRNYRKKNFYGRYKKFRYNYNKNFFVHSFFLREQLDKFLLGRGVQMLYFKVFQRRFLRQFFRYRLFEAFLKKLHFIKLKLRYNFFNYKKFFVLFKLLLLGYIKYDKIRKNRFFSIALKRKFFKLVLNYFLKELKKYRNITKFVVNGIKNGGLVGRVDANNKISRSFKKRLLLKKKTKFGGFLNNKNKTSKFNSKDLSNKNKISKSNNKDALAVLVVNVLKIFDKEKKQSIVSDDNKNKVAIVKKIAKYRRNNQSKKKFYYNFFKEKNYMFNSLFSLLRNINEIKLKKNKSIVAEKISTVNNPLRILKEKNYKNKILFYNNRFITQTVNEFYGGRRSNELFYFKKRTVFTYFLMGLKSLVRKRFFFDFFFIRSFRGYKFFIKKFNAELDNNIFLNFFIKKNFLVRFRSLFLSKKANRQRFLRRYRYRKFGFFSKNKFKFQKNVNNKFNFRKSTENKFKFQKNLSRNKFKFQKNVNNKFKFQKNVNNKFNFRKNTENKFNLKFRRKYMTSPVARVFFDKFKFRRNLNNKFNFRKSTENKFKFQKNLSRNKFKFQKNVNNRFKFSYFGNINNDVITINNNEQEKNKFFFKFFVKKNLFFNNFWNFFFISFFSFKKNLNRKNLNRKNLNRKNLNRKSLNRKKYGRFVWNFRMLFFFNFLILFNFLVIFRKRYWKLLKNLYYVGKKVRVNYSRVYLKELFLKNFFQVYIFIFSMSFCVIRFFYFCLLLKKKFVLFLKKILFLKKKSILLYTSKLKKFRLYFLKLKNFLKFFKLLCFFYKNILINYFLIFVNYSGLLYVKRLINYIYIHHFIKKLRMLFYFKVKQLLNMKFVNNKFSLKNCFVFPLFESVTVEAFSLYMRYKLKKKFYFKAIFGPIVNKMDRLLYLRGAYSLGNGRFTRRQRSSTYKLGKGVIGFSTATGSLNYVFLPFRTKYGACSIRLWFNYKKFFYNNNFLFLV